MTRRVVTAREQVQMLAPWIRHASGATLRWERDSRGEWILVTRNPDGNPVALDTRRAPVERTGSQVADPGSPPSIHELIPGRFSNGNGRWEYRHRETSGDRYPRHEYDIHPAESPTSHTFTNEHGRTYTVHYDPDLTGGQVPRPGKWGHEWDDHDALRSEITDLQPPPGMLWRGMSREEYERSRERGYFESDGGHNFDFQQGLTYFSTKPEQAGNYATWFAPAAYKPTFTHPGYVVGIPDRPEVPRGGEPGRPDPTSTEVGLPGRIPFSEATHHYVARPSTIRPGQQGVAQDWHGWQESGGAHPSSTILWSRISPTRQARRRHHDGIQP